MINNYCMSTNYEIALERFRLYKSGMILADVGLLFNVTRQSIEQQFKRYGFDKSLGGSKLRSRERKEEFLKNRNSKFFSKHGSSYEQWKSMPNDVRTKYKNQKQKAKQRGIAWLFTPESWWNFWQSSGKWDVRGKGEGHCMARKGDVGPYSPENVYICTIGQNFSDAWNNKKWDPHAKRRLTSENN